ncbi:prephenate dehydratase [Corynebacterium marinum]|uniref:Prephenate dehydratase n=1 Tax=Corynebacterium marinum DSM 44953 TaxID=1224162 RepID=A0A0B6TZ14_9CORY|nr:prephenate dehydratase [Corynebacterium marinum]AJK69921.1 Prephenate dehydratase [Corynebacterium marinum DSM 44953]GGO19425.1 prephenate dehydratase [Corynebacterium marinum]
MTQPAVTVAYLGPAGTFTEAALIRFQGAGAFGAGEVEQLPVSSPREALDAVRVGRAQFACVAIENSVDGSVTSTFDALVEDGGVQIYHELEIEIAFSIMVRPGARLAEAKKFATHPVAHQQVRKWLAANIPGAQFVPASSNAAAAQAVAEGRADAAAAPDRAAVLFGLDVVEKGVADMAGARTRFVVVGPRGVPTPRTGSDQTTVVFTLPNEPGTLVGALTEFSLRGVSLSRIESRPTRREFGTYHFYADLVGHIDDAPVAEALRALWLRAEDISYLGSWPTPGRGGRDAALAADLARLERAAAWVAAAREGKEL